MATRIPWSEFRKHCQECVQALTTDDKTPNETCRECLGRPTEQDLLGELAGLKQELSDLDDQLYEATLMVITDRHEMLTKIVEERDEARARILGQRTTFDAATDELKARVEKLEAEIERLEGQAEFDAGSLAELEAERRSRRG